MLRSLISTAAITLALSTPVLAETFEVQMLNRGEEGTMVFEPSNLRVASGDTVKFVATDRGHNAEVVEGMMPEGSEAFVGKINEEIEVTFDVDGFYGGKCKPHFAMGMVMVIAVGDDATPQEGFLEGRLPRNAKERFEAQLSAF
jgi:pseudoazurin